MTRTILAIDTSTLIASTAIVCGSNVLAQHESGVNTHSERLLSLIDACLQDAHKDLRTDIDAIALGAGPGSFTGLRIGMATAKGLCYAANKPLWLASSLAALALEALSETKERTIVVDEHSLGGAGLELGRYSESIPFECLEGLALETTHASKYNNHQQKNDPSRRVRWNASSASTAIAWLWVGRWFRIWGKGYASQLVLDRDNRIVPGKACSGTHNYKHGRPAPR